MTSSWRLVAGFLLAAMGAFVKLGAEYFGAAELAFYRSLVTLLAAFAFISTTRGTVKSTFTGTHLIRGIVGAISTSASPRSNGPEWRLSSRAASLR